MYASIQIYCSSLTKKFNTVSAERKIILNRITAYIQTQIEHSVQINLNYICTHNSRRSHFGQVWAKVAAKYYNVENVHTFSGGTEATAFNANAIGALERVGFTIEKTSSAENPLYKVYFSDQNFVACFSKTYFDSSNPSKDFAAIMTCTDADVKCPIVNGAAIKIATPYEDPKVFDGTEIQDIKYNERCEEIALECMYVFSKVMVK